MGERKGLLVVLSGPSGVGKSTVLRRLKRRRWPWPLRVVTTVTTRPKRRGERQGVPYHFLSHEEFARWEAEGRFVESAVVYGERYGVPRAAIEGPLSEGATVVLQTDVQGAATLKQRYPEAVLIFLAAPSRAELKRRLEERGLDSEESLRRRLATADREMQQVALFDYLVVNETGNLAGTLEKVRAILIAERCRVQRQLDGPGASGLA